MEGEVGVGMGVGVNMMVRGLGGVAYSFQLHLSRLQYSYMNNFVQISSERPSMGSSGT